MPDSGDRTAELDEQDVSALKEMSEWWRSSKVGRRAVIGASAAGIGAALTGGYGAGTAAAQPTGDEGQVGQETDRVEAWVSEIDANEFSLGSDGPATSFDDIGGGTPNVEFIEPGDDWQAAVDSVSDGARHSGYVRVVPQRSFRPLDMSNTTLPVVVKPGITLDIRNTNLRPPQDQNIFDLREGVRIIGHNALIDDPGDGLSGGNVFVADGSNSDAPGSENPAQVLGYPAVRANGYSAIVYVTTDGTNPVYSSRFEVAGWNGPRFVHLDNQSAGSNSINVNEFVLLGSFAGGSGEDMIHLTGDSIIADNDVYGVVQVKSGRRVVHIERGRRNNVDGYWVDVNNVDNTPFAIGSGGRGGNEIRNRWRGVNGPDAAINSGAIEFIHQMPHAHSPKAQDLTSVTADAGDLRQNYKHYHSGADGNNTNAQGPAFYDGADWVSLVDGGTIT